MIKRYPIVTLCGSTRFKSEFEKVQKDLTLKGFIVISVGLFGHFGDNEVWENMSEGQKTKTKMMLDDMHKSKIDMADIVFVVNPDGYIGESTWSEICYASMVEKEIEFLEPISECLIQDVVKEHLTKAERYAWEQFDYICHVQPYYDKENMAYFKYKKEDVFDPWYCDNEKLVNDDPYPCHGDKRKGFDPFRIYGKENMARFVEDVIMKKEH